MLSPAVLTPAALAGCLTYFLIAPSRVSQQVPPTAVAPSSTVGQVRAIDTLTNIDRRPRAEEIANAFRRAAEVNALKQATEDRQPVEAQDAALDTDEPAIAGPVPLPNRRPPPRP